MLLDCNFVLIFFLTQNNLILYIGKFIARTTFWRSLTIILILQTLKHTLLDPKTKYVHQWMLGFYFSCLANTTCILRVINGDVKRLPFLLEKHERIKDCYSLACCVNNNRNKVHLIYSNVPRQDHLYQQPTS